MVNLVMKVRVQKIIINRNNKIKKNKIRKMIKMIKEFSH